MKRPSKLPRVEEKPSPAVADGDTILPVKVWLAGISPMIWRRVLVPATFTLRELHGVIQVAMGWEGIHLYDFHLRATRYGSWEVAASSPDVTLAALRFRKGQRFIYEYDLNIPWRHEVRIEDRLEPEARKTYPVCTGGDGACQPKDCAGPESFMGHRDDWFSFDALEDLDTMVEVLQEVARKGRVGDRGRWLRRRTRTVSSLVLQDQVRQRSIIRTCDLITAPKGYALRKPGRRSQSGQAVATRSVRRTLGVGWRLSRASATDACRRLLPGIG
jgi:hypothetical protein